MSDKIVDRIAKLLNQAENAATPEEAEAFMAKAQVVATTNGVELALARARQADKSKPREMPEKRTVRIAPQGEWRISLNTKYLSELFLAVAGVNDLECHIGGEGRTIYPHGFPSDHEVTEALYASLAVQMVSAGDAALKRGDHRRTELKPKLHWVELEHHERAWGEVLPDNPARYYADGPEDVGRYVWGNGDTRYEQIAPPTRGLKPVLDEDGQPVMEEKSVARVDGRVFRANFYAGFISSITLRLHQAKREAVQEVKRVQRELAAAAGTDIEAASSETALVLRSKREEVSEFVKETLGGRKLRGTHKGYSGSDSSYVGHSEGRAAGERARLGSSAEVGAANRKALG